MRTISKEAKEAYVELIHKMMESLHEKTKAGYVQMSLSDFVKTSDVWCPPLITSALTQKGIVKCIGSNRDRRCHWTKGSPSLSMAREVFEFAQIMQRQSKAQKIEDRKYLEKTKKLVPVLDKNNQPIRRVPADGNDNTATRYLGILNELYKEKNYVINTKALSVKHRVDEKDFFGPLIELGIIKPAKNIPGQYMWADEAPSQAMVDLMLMSASPKVQKEHELNNSTLKFLEYLHKSSPHKGSLTAQLNTYGLAPAYLTVIRKMGIIKNTGTHHEPCYVYGEMLPTEQLANRVRNEVNAYYIMNNNKSRHARRPKIEQGYDESKDADLLENTDAAVRTVNALNNVDITRVSQLAKMTESGLMKIRNFGQSSIEDVKRILHERGLSLACAHKAEVSESPVEIDFVEIADRYLRAQPNEFGRQMVAELNRLRAEKSKIDAKIDAICRLMQATLDE